MLTGRSMTPTKDEPDKWMRVDDLLHLVIGTILVAVGLLS